MFFFCFSLFRLIKRLKIKDPRQIELERLEQGFSIYLNGANAEASRKQPKGSDHKFVSAQSPRGPARAAGMLLLLLRLILNLQLKLHILIEDLISPLSCRESYLR